MLNMNNFQCWKTLKTNCNKLFLFSNMIKSKYQNMLTEKDLKHFLILIETDFKLEEESLNTL